MQHLQCDSGLGTVQAFVTQHYSTEFLYFPLNQAQLPAGSYSKPKFNVSSWDYLDDKARFTPFLSPQKPVVESQMGTWNPIALDTG